MAGNPVRELITRVKFQLDQQSVNNVNRAIENVKKKLDGLSKSKKIKISIDASTQKITQLNTLLNSLKNKNLSVKVHVNSASVNGAIQQIKNKLQNINLNAHINANVAGMTIRANVVNLHGVIHGNTGNVGGHVSGSNGGSSVRGSFADNAGAVMATGAAMVAPLALPVDTAMEFEAAMSKVKAITNSTDADMARLTQTARELGANTQYSATEAAQAMSYLGMAGWKTEQIISGMPGLLDLAAASGEDLARVADIVSDDLTAFKMPAEQAAHMADVMAAASTNANTNVSMMGETFKYAGAVAGALGYTFEDVAVATGLMANSGVKAEMAGTALRSIMTRLVTPPKEAATAMDTLGISVKNSDGTVKSFRQQMVELRKAFSGLTEAQQSSAAKAIAGQEAMAGFLAIINASEDDFNKMTGAVDNSNGAAHDMAQTMNKSAKGALKALKSALEDVAITIGNVFLESLSSATKAFTEFIRKFGEFAKAHPEIIAGIMATVAAVGGLLVALGGIGFIVSGIVSSFEALSAVFGAISGALSVGFGPLLVVIGLIAAAIKYVSENWDETVARFQPGIDMMLDGMQKFQQAWADLQPLIQAIQPLLDIIIDLIGSGVVQAVANAWNLFATAFNGMATLAQNVGNAVSLVVSIVESLSSALSGVIDKLRDFVGLSGSVSSINLGSSVAIAGAVPNINTEQNNVFNVNSVEEANAVQEKAGAMLQAFGEYD